MSQVTSKGIGNGPLLNILSSFPNTNATWDLLRYVLWQGCHPVLHIDRASQQAESVGYSVRTRTEPNGDKAKRVTYDKYQQKEVTMNILTLEQLATLNNWKVAYGAFLDSTAPSSIHRAREVLLASAVADCMVAGIPAEQITQLQSEIRSQHDQA